MVHWPYFEMDTFQHTDKKPLNTQIQNLSIHKYKTCQYHKYKILQQTNINISMQKYTTFEHTNKKPFNNKIQNLSTHE